MMIPQCKDHHIFVTFLLNGKGCVTRVRRDGSPPARGRPNAMDSAYLAERASIAAMAASKAAKRVSRSRVRRALSGAARKA